MTHTSMNLALDGVSISIGEIAICTDVSLAVGAGRVVGIVGPNGSGKTTLLRAVYRMLRPRLGQVLVADEDVWVLRPREVARRMAVVVQEPRADFEFTVGEVVAMGRTPHQSALARESHEDRQLIDAALAHVGMSAFGDRLHSTLSGGEKQRVMIARAIAQEARVLILDEPTNHLDIRYQIEVLELVRELRVTTLMAIHDLNLAAVYCDEVVVMSQGAVVASGAAQQVLRPEVLEPVFEVDVEVVPRAGARALLSFRKRSRVG